MALRKTKIPPMGWLTREHLNGSSDSRARYAWGLSFYYPLAEIARHMKLPMGEVRSLVRLGPSLYPKRVAEKIRMDAAHG